MIELNFDEFTLLWGIYSMSVILSILLGYYARKSMEKVNKNKDYPRSPR